MILKNSQWHKKSEVKLGDYGEQIVRKILELCGFVLYQSISDHAHLIDFIVALDKKFIFAVDVKTKPMMKKYAETGFDYSHYKHYIAFSKQMNIPVMIIFVDPLKKTLYGNFLSVLDEPRIQNGIKYPKTIAAKFFKQGKLIRYYPECAMLPIGTLSDTDVAILQQYTTRHY